MNKLQCLIQVCSVGEEPTSCWLANRTDRTDFWGLRKQKIDVALLREMTGLP